MTDRYRSIEDTLSDSQLEDLRRLFEGEWWSGGRSPEEVRGIVEASQVIVGHVDTETDTLVSFARVVTDFHVFAVVLDVIVDPSLRGAGLGRRLMDDIFSHPRLQGLRGIGLQCRAGTVRFSARWGFHEKEVTPDSSLQLVRRFDRDAGERPATCVTSSAAR
jgi:ribosomal protein S18 acetylase RimI-like enzyme